MPANRPPVLLGDTPEGAGSPWLQVPEDPAAAEAAE